MTPGYARALWAVIAINGAMFGVEVWVGVWVGALAGSQALWADALDFLADTLTCAISFAVLGRRVRVRTTAALAKTASLGVMGVWVLVSTIWQMFGPHLPVAEIMRAVGLLALAANVASVLILMRYSKGDASVHSV
jgi:Co/Zn/Cd efflux system component